MPFSGELLIVTDIIIVDGEEKTDFKLFNRPEGEPRFRNVTNESTLADWQSAPGYDPNDQELTDFLSEFFDINDGEGPSGTTLDFGGHL